MQGRSRTQRENYFEDLQKMERRLERRLKDEDPGPKPSNRSKPGLSHPLRDTMRWVMETHAVEDFYGGLLNRLAS